MKMVIFISVIIPHGMAHWHHLVSTIEPSVCGDDAVLCQITLTTCYIMVTDVIIAVCYIAVLSSL